MTVRAGRLYLGRPEPRETLVLDGCLRLCNLHRAVAWVWRQNVGAGTFIRPDGSTSQFMRFGFAGLSDICGGLWGGRALFVETKRPSEDLGEPQAKFLDHVRGAGALAVRVRSVDELQAILDAELERMKREGVPIGQRFIVPTPKRKAKPKRADRAHNGALDLGNPF